MPFQFSMRQLLLVFVILSVVCAGLASPSAWWASVAVTALTVWLLAAAAIAIGSQGERRIFWIGVLVVGVAYSTITSRGAGYSRITGPVAWASGSIEFGTSQSELLTTKTLETLYLRIHAEKYTPQPAPAIPAYPAPSPNWPVSAPPSPYAPASTPPPPIQPVMSFNANRYAQFLAVGESFFTFAFSLAGGWLAALCYSRRETSS